MDIIKQPWPWYVSGSLIGLTVPALLLLGNKHFGVSGSFRQLCAACFPANIAFFAYDWKKELWNLFFVAGISIGGAIAANYGIVSQPVKVHPALVQDMAKAGINDYSGMVPKQLISFRSLLSLRGFIIMVFGGFLIGFGSRYAGGCTSGHGIMGLSTLQWPSLVATICFLLGGSIMSNLLLPYILAL